ncbi:ABC transporter ATP-binding protein [Lysinibacter cavernae]|uniref:ABC-2 type transport system ATP-binding protein n=1 Tax=Lysinibacter cavernae TaxID=1640652 RepID=A0A7X5R0I4_9MICO|nr:ABC transporter ATP-binding protein [Lysinibacter cavernae]NIH53207.1 ABC-2 type transport system ATP-binding protein [Lysinibacter cavernae]
MSYTIETADLTKRFGSRVALNNISLQVPPGKIFGLIGPNGAGKTTTMRILLDIMRPTSGTVSVLGTSPHRGGVGLRRKIGYLPGELSLEGRVTGHALLSHYADLSGGVPRADITALTDRLDLDLSRQVHGLSKGNKQKLGIVQALMHRPPLLVLDEPTSGLDPLVQQTFLELVREARDAGQTVLLSSHVLSEIEQVADEVALLRRGEIATVSTVSALRESATRRVVAKLRGSTSILDTLTQVQGLTAIEHQPGEEADGVLHISGALEGSPDPFIKALARFDVLDVSIEAPNLEDAVLGLYEGGQTHER